MAIFLYCGVPGSGKSYEAVSSLIVPAFKKGRRVCSSITGITQETLTNYLVPRGFPNFLYEHCDNSEINDDFITALKPGTLLVIDEAWGVFGLNKPPSPAFLEFLRLHRHQVDLDTGFCTDIVLITQSPSDLHSSIRNVIETTIRFTKLKALGSETRYKAEVFAGSRMRKADKITSRIEKYDKNFFPIYKSYDGAGGKEAKLDGRANALKSPLFISSLAALIALPYFLYRAFTYFSSEPKLNSTLQQPELASAPKSAPKENKALVAVIKKENSIDLVFQGEHGLTIENGNLVGPDTYQTELGENKWLGYSYPSPQQSQQPSPATLLPSL